MLFEILFLQSAFVGVGRGRRRAEEGRKGGGGRGGCKAGRGGCKSILCFRPCICERGTCFGPAELAQRRVQCQNQRESHCKASWSYVKVEQKQNNESLLSNETLPLISLFSTRCNGNKCKEGTNNLNSLKIYCTRHS